MSEHLRAGSSIFDLPPADIAGFDSLAELALDLRWSWNHATDDLWRQLDPGLWELTQNPWIVLQTVSRDQLARLLDDPAFRKSVDDRLEAKRHALEAPAWFQKHHPETLLTCVAYFSMEFMLSEALPIYSGGLGNVAGDQLKAASDLGVPVVGVGLLYQQGYFRQVIDQDGAQQALFPYNDPGQLPITPVRLPNGEWLRLEIALPGYSVWLRAWQVQVGRVRLYLLDSNDAANFPAHRGITSELYGGGPELRLKQELLLGIGGWRLLAALGLRPEVCHLNEGHAAFAILERARDFMEANGQPFDVALAVNRAGNLFTTHTAVAAGFDRFPPDLVARHLTRYAEQKLGISIETLLGLGRQHPHDSSESFNMAYLAIRGSGAVNGVSRLHGKVSRVLFEPLFPRWPTEEVPVGHVTNGIHVPSWDSAAADALWTQAGGKSRWLGSAQPLKQDIRRVFTDRLWEFRTAARQSFVDFARARLGRQLAVSGASTAEIEKAQHFLDPGALTLGFARRFATYKRPNLLLHDPERLLRLLTNAQRPVQLILAGKAHPADEAGQSLIQEWTRFSRCPQARGHIVFLSDYDMQLAEHMVQGMDVWLNTPERPWEACGTSGMKVLVNGGLNCSELDGWWAEAYQPDLGWALGDGREHAHDPGWNRAEAEMLYETLERDVVPEFYDRDANGIPAAWIARIRESMARLTPQFSADRAVREYTEQQYVPAAAAYCARAAKGGAAGQKIAAWQRDMHHYWPRLKFGAVNYEVRGETCEFEIQVYLGDLKPAEVRVELFAPGLLDGPAARLEMKPMAQGAVVEDGYVYTATVSGPRPPTDYTARIVPVCNGAALPLEDARILWQR
jgi:starch phosphorylase